MISIPQGFTVGSMEAIDARFALTFEEMAVMKDNLMPQVYFTICKDDSNIYVYNKSNEPIEKLGKFRLYAGNAGESDSAPIDIEQIQTLFIDKEEND